MAMLTATAAALNPSYDATERAISLSVGTPLLACRPAFQRESRVNHHRNGITDINEFRAAFPWRNVIDT